MKRYLACLLLCLGTVSADEIKPVPDPISSKIHLPTMPVLVEPNEPTPQPLPGPPLPISIISGDQWYVIESSVPLIVLASPDGFVSIEPSEGPIKVRGVFADGTGKVETRTFSQPYVYFVNAKASGKVELLVIPQGVTSEADIIRQPLTVTVGPRPPPIPPEPPTPPDPPTPPTPDIPDDVWDNIGRRVDSSVKTLPDSADRKDVAKAIQSIGDRMANFTIKRVEDSSKELKAVAVKYPKYKSVFDMIQQDGSQRIVSFAEAKDYYSAIAVGFHGSK